MKHRILLMGTVLVVALVGLCGCASAVGKSDSPTLGDVGSNATDTAGLGSEFSGVPLAVGATVPNFTGPYAAEFENAYRNSTSDLQRQVLADGVLTDQEVSALHDYQKICLEGYGMTDVEINADGTSSIKPPTGMSSTRAEDIYIGCSQLAYGMNMAVATLVTDLSRNPQNLDKGEIMVACLKRFGLVPDSYTAADYYSDAPNDTLPFDTNDPNFSLCINDPTNAGK